MKKLSVEVRKIQRTADGTYMLSLPKNWAKRFNLKRGSPIYLRERSDGCLVLDPEYAVEVSPEITLKASERLEDRILSSYLLGYELILVQAPRVTEELMKRIKRVVARLIGVEIIEESPQTVVLQCLLKASASPPEKILRRQYVLSSSLCRDALSHLVDFDVEKAALVRARDEEIDRLYFLLVRLLRSLILNPRLSEKLNISLIDCLDYRLIASLIENMADEAVKIAESTVAMGAEGRLPPELTQAIASFQESFQAAFEEAMRALFSKDERLQTSALRKKAESQRALEKIKETFTLYQQQTPPAFYNLIFLFDQIVDYLTDMIDLVTPSPPPKTS
ncbi:phosphate uptake regulator PhoU [Candidatus Hecatella orcuttiae]|uniref:phosphate uptake regulator PhoU n=1 Tax=Candidatus Hecatella orcuttiae TaxID=1935119 RepID=UPI0028681547|nr:phosphate uptake regulator PhoU [Candidatus Hecatella orcuttiae]